MPLEEAAAYSNIGINKLREIIKDKDCSFVICVGNKRLIRRKKFEEFLSKNSVPSLDKKGLPMV